MEPTAHHEQPKPSIHKTEQERCDTERSAAVSKSETSTNQKSMDVSKVGEIEIVYTRQWIRENTKIYGLLEIFINWILPISAILIFTFGILTPIRSGSCDVITFISSLLDTSLCIVVFFLFHLRRPNAVYYAYLLVRLTCLSSIYLIVVSELNPLPLVPIIRLGIYIGFLIYLGLSEQVKDDVIPVPFREVSKLDRIVYWGVFTCWAIILFFYEFSIADWAVLIACSFCFMLPQWGQGKQRS